MRNRKPWLQGWLALGSLSRCRVWDLDPGWWLLVLEPCLASSVTLVLPEEWSEQGRPSGEQRS